MTTAPYSNIFRTRFTLDRPTLRILKSNTQVEYSSRTLNIISAARIAIVLKRISLQVNTNLDALPDVLAWFDDLRQPFVSNMDWLQCQTALAEGFTNAVRHAHSGLPSSTPVELEASLTEKELEIKIWDYGPGFNFAQKLKETSAQVNAHSTGGRGLDIMYQVAHDISYERDGTRNCLTLLRLLSK